MSPFHLRLVADKLGDKLGQRLVVENQPGAGGIECGAHRARRRADGYTLGLVTNGTAISVPLFKALPFDPIKEFALISTLGAFDLVFVVNAKSPIRTLQDFVKTARERPGKLNVGTINIGSTQNLGAELFKFSAGVDSQIVPYRGTPEIIIAILRNDVDLMVEFHAAVRAGLADGKLRALAVSRNCPFAEPAERADRPGGRRLRLRGRLVERHVRPAGTPADVITVLNGAVCGTSWPIPT